MTDREFNSSFFQMTGYPDNPYHPLVWIHGEPEIGAGTYIGGFSIINGKGARVTIGENCDIASFVSVNCSDSHLHTIGLMDNFDKRDITIEDNVFIGSHCIVLGGAVIGHHSVIAAGSVVRSGIIPAFSLAIGNPMVVKPGYYRQRIEARNSAEGR